MCLWQTTSGYTICTGEQHVRRLSFWLVSFCVYGACEQAPVIFPVGPPPTKKTNNGPKGAAAATAAAASASAAAAAADLVSAAASSAAASSAAATASTAEAASQAYAEHMQSLHPYDPCYPPSSLQNWWKHQPLDAPAATPRDNDPPHAAQAVPVLSVFFGGCAKLDAPDLQPPTAEAVFVTPDKIKPAATPAAACTSTPVVRVPPNSHPHCGLLCVVYPRAVGLLSCHRPHGRAWVRSRVHGV